ncbi:hypothetical protein [Helicobacter pylori]|uniref:hypothetical protein n=1 Tax=Helicobacter pylori TaxID=210 RepID=UPI0031339678
MIMAVNTITITRNNKQSNKQSNKHTNNNNKHTNNNNKHTNNNNKKRNNKTNNIDWGVCGGGLRATPSF